MPHILITGAGGFVGQALARALCDGLGGFDFTQLTLLDVQLPPSAVPKDARVRVLNGSLTDAAVLAEALTPAPALVFHLAAITSGQAEREYELGLQVNLQGSIALFEALRVQGQNARLVQTSSIGVFGLPLPTQQIDDHTAVAPTLSYGTHKRMLELLLADHSRRGWIDGRSPRLPSVVTRPALPNGALSSFASDLIRELAAGRNYVSPVAADGQIWLLSLPATVNALLHAAQLPPEALPPGRAWTLPALRASIGEIVDALVQLRGDAPLRERLRYAPDAALTAQFACWPPLHTATADALGFRADASLAELLALSLRDLPAQP